jgi:hypothetical protein
VSLFDIPGMDFDPGVTGGGDPPGKAFSRRDVFKFLGSQLDEMVVIQIAGSRNDDPIRLIKSGKEPLDRIGIEPQNIFPGAENRPSQGMIAPYRAAGKHVHVLVRTVFHHADFL